MTGGTNHIIESEKMAATGNLIADIAYDLKIPIGVCITVTSSTEELIEQARRKIKHENCE